ncbi:Protein TRIGALACTOSYLDIACYLGLYCEROL 2, chloroplastic [Asimina triloba]
MASSSLIRTPSGNQYFVPYLPARTPRVGCIRASSENSGQSPMPLAEKKNPLTVVLDVPSSIWRQTLRPLSDFGFGRKSIWEGGVGLFVVSGAVILTLALAWLRAFHLKSRFKKYQTVFEFSQACGICMGTPVRIRGVTVGTVVRIIPSLKSIEAVAEVEDDKVIIPRNSLIEVNQSGLLMETLIDITPQDPLPTPSAGPLDPECAKEGLIVCDRQKIAGRQGTSLDELVGIFTRLGRDMEEIGVSKSYTLAEKVATVIEESKPLLAKVRMEFPPFMSIFGSNDPDLVQAPCLRGHGGAIEAMAEDIQPLLSEARTSGLLKEVESLTKSLTEATEDLRSVNSSVLTPENTKLIRQSVSTLLSTLKNIESISSDVSGFTGDEVTRQNLKLLVKSLTCLIVHPAMIKTEGQEVPICHPVTTDPPFRDVNLRSFAFGNFMVGGKPSEPFLPRMEDMQFLLSS